MFFDKEKIDKCYYDVNTLNGKSVRLSVLESEVLRILSAIDEDGNVYTIRVDEVNR